LNYELGITLRVSMTVLILEVS